MTDKTSEIVFGGGEPRSARPLGLSLRRGAKGCCPACGKGRLFSRMLTVTEQCPDCGEALHHHRADDLPAYLNIFLTGHVVIALMMIAMDAEILSDWGIAVLTAAVAVIFAGLLMRPLKGMVVGAQWALAMHGFGGHDD